jgi:hypothetical protein
MEAWIKSWARETAKQVIGELETEAIALHRQGGGPLASLFLIQRKSELRKYCRRARIAKRQFSYTIMACEMGLLPWRHRISHRNFVPEHLNPTGDEMNAMHASLAAGNRSLPKALRKIMRQFDERRMLVGHIFYNDDLSRWHLLYFDQRDSSPHQNHWIEGSHIHLLNWLLRPGQDANEAWREFHEGNPKLRGALHIGCAFE